MKTVRKHITKQSQSIPAFRQWLGYVLLVCFLTTIFFPGIHVPGAIKKFQNLTSTSDNEISLAEYVLEGYLEMEEPVSSNSEKDVEDSLKTTDDLDLLAHLNLNLIFGHFRKKNNKYNRLDQLLVHTFYSSPTPPPEY